MTPRLRAAAFLLAACVVPMTVGAAASELVGGVDAKRLAWAVGAVLTAVGMGLWEGRRDPSGIGRAAGGAISAASPRADSLPVRLSPGRAITDPDDAEALGLRVRRRPS